jgi:hypothetical protein
VRSLWLALALVFAAFAAAPAVAGPTVGDPVVPTAAPLPCAGLKGPARKKCLASNRRKLSRGRGICRKTHGKANQARCFARAIFKWGRTRQAPKLVPGKPRATFLGFASSPVVPPKVVGTFAGNSGDLRDCRKSAQHIVAYYYVENLPDDAMIEERWTLPGAEMAAGSHPAPATGLMVSDAISRTDDNGAAQPLQNGRHTFTLYYGETKLIKAAVSRRCH